MYSKLFPLRSSFFKSRIATSQPCCSDPEAQTSGDYRQSSVITWFVVVAGVSTVFAIVGCSATEANEAASDTGQTVAQDVVPLTIETAAQGTAVALAPVGAELASIGATTVAVGGTAVAHSFSLSRFNPWERKMLYREPEEQEETPYTEEISRLRREVDAQKSFKRALTHN